METAVQYFEYPRTNKEVERHLWYEHGIELTKQEKRRMELPDKLHFHKIMHKTRGDHYIGHTHEDDA